MDHDTINRRAREIDSANTVREKGTRTRGAVIEYFDGEDLTGTIHKNANTYAAFVAVVTDSGAAGFNTRQNKAVGTLRRDLGEAFKAAGFTKPNGSFSIPGRDGYDEIPSSIGPLMPAILAILEVEHGIDSTAAVRRHRPDSLSRIQPEQADEDSSSEKQSVTDWSAKIREAPGFDPDAESYVYVLELTRKSDSSTWFYVGKREGQLAALQSRIRTHASEFTQSRTVEFGPAEILVGNHNYSVDLQGATHQVVDIERLVSISGETLAALEDSTAESCYVSEVERRTAYEVAIENDTTNVLGGK